MTEIFYRSHLTPALAPAYYADGGFGGYGSCGHGGYGYGGCCFIDHPVIEVHDCFINSRRRRPPDKHYVPDNPYIEYDDDDDSFDSKSIDGRSRSVQASAVGRRRVVA